MLSRWFAAYRYFLRRFLGLRMRPCLFNELFDVREVGITPSPINMALILYVHARANRTSNPDGPLPDSPSPRIREVQLKKCPPTRAEHEYLLVEIVSASGVGIGELKFERAYDPADDYAVPSTLADSSDPSSTASSAPGTHTLPSKLDQDPIPARDTITFDPDDTYADTAVFSYTFNKASAPSLLDLLVAADSLNIHSPQYISPERQSYWYAAMLFRILLGEIDVDPPVQRGAARTAFSPAFELCGTDTKDTSPEPVRAGRAGTFKRLFSMVTNKSVDSLYKDEFKQVYQLRHAEVTQLVNPREELARQAEAAREEAARQAEAAREAKAESARLREELARLRAAAPERLGAIPPAQ